MKLWSRGLGKTEIDMDLRYYKLVTDPETGLLTLIGNMQSPVTWEFTIKIEPDDIAGVIKLALNLPLLKFAAKNLYRYPIYLKNRKDFVLEDDENLEKRVMDTYKKMTSPSPDRKRGGKKREKREKRERPKVVAQETATAGA